MYLGHRRPGGADDQLEALEYCVIWYRAFWHMIRSLRMGNISPGHRYRAFWHLGIRDDGLSGPDPECGHSGIRAFGMTGIRAQLRSWAFGRSDVRAIGQSGNRAFGHSRWPGMLSALAPWHPGTTTLSGCYPQAGQAAQRRGVRGAAARSGAAALP
eukprot:scaffold13611_cov52-Phaeocystis_antarctica.AAC.1